MMTTLFAVSVLALAVLAVWFVAVLAIRLFTKRRPPLCTRFTVAVAVVAVGKPAETIELVTVREGESLKYYRKYGVHYVPKLPAEDLII